MNHITVAAVSMTSLELVDFINSQRVDGDPLLAHSDFLKKVPQVLGEGAGNFSSTYRDVQNKERPCYTFPKREACLMAMSYSYDIQAKVFDRMTALEAGAKPMAIADRHDSAIAPSKEFRALFGIARLIGCDKNAAAISANQAVTKITGTNVLALLGQTHLAANNQQAMYFTPTELGDRMNISGRKFNMLLAEAGLQSKKGEHWIPSAEAEGFCRIMDTGKRHGDGTMIQQIKWADNVLALVSEGAAA